MSENQRRGGRRPASEEPDDKTTESAAEIEARLRAELEEKIRKETEDKLRAEYEALQEANQPIEGKTEEQLAQELLDKAEKGARLPGEPDVGLDPNAPEGSKIYHFLEDGFTVLGQTWRRGQEIMVKPGTTEWDLLHDKDGKNVLDQDRITQMRRYGRHMFDVGPWPYDDFDLADPSLTEQERQALAKISAKRQIIMDQIAKRSGKTFANS